ncbi:hypothetical protein OROGR_031042 [Orobanche gracilis]
MGENEEEILPKFTFRMSHEAKLKDLLRNLASVESQLFSEASKEFIKILKSASGPEFLYVYLRASSKLIEISHAWEVRKGKPGFSHILNLSAAILKHGKDNNVVGNGGAYISQTLDEFALALTKEKMGDFYKELSSTEANAKRQNAVLLLLATIVKRNSHLAWELANVFDFKLASFPQLAGVRLRAKKFAEGKRKSHSTRKAFVSFAMSFLEIGNPRLLRGVLQKKEMYSGVFRGLGNDDEETIIYVLSVLRDRVLVPESLVPPGLRSVLFGSVTLEHLAKISGRDDFGDAAELAHNVLIMVCTDAVNGLMPDMDRHPSPLRGNLKRLLDLMKKLKATDVEYHMGLLLAIVKGRPSFGSAYLDEFPCSLEDLASNNWVAAISLAADVVSSVSDGLSFGFLDKPPTYDSLHVQSILKCIAPRPLTKLVINKGLLHADYRVKHVTLKFVVEALKLLDSLIRNLDSSSRSNEQTRHSWKALIADIQDGVLLSLPDPQVLFSLLSPLTSHFKSLSKRKAETEISSGSSLNVNKRLKSSARDEDLDIIISGVNSSELDLTSNGRVSHLGDEQQPENGAIFVKCGRDIWGLHQRPMPHVDVKDADAYFYSKILDSLKLCYRTLPTAVGGLFDLFRFLPNNPLVLPTILQQSLLQLLNEHVSQFSKGATPMRTPPQMYKHLHPFIVLLMCSRVRHIKEQAYALAKAAMLSTGAFDSNTKEICAWFLFISGPNGDHVYVEGLEEEIFQKLSSIVVSFLCDAVSTIGNNLYKYMQLLKHYIYDSEGGEVRPFVICVLEKCLRLLSSESGCFTIPQKSLISHYVCNTIKYLLDTQVNAGTLSCLVDRVLSEKLQNCSSRVDILELVDCPCEWRPLKILLRLARDIMHQAYYSIYSSVEDVMPSKGSFINTLEDIKGVLRSEYDSGLVGLAVAFSFSLTCTRPTELLQNFPLVLSISYNLFEIPFSVLSSIFFLEPGYLTDVLKVFPEMFIAALDGAILFEREKTMSYKVDMDSTEVVSVAFARFLKVAPFCVLFSSIAQSNSLRLLGLSSVQKLLLDKLTGIQFDDLISSLCNVLFWINHTSSCYRVRLSDELKMLSKICFILAEHLLKQLLVENMDTLNPARVEAPLQLHYAAEVAEIIFNHPIVASSLSCPLFGNMEFSDSVFGETLEKLLVLSEQIVHQMDHCVLNLIITASEILFQMCVDQVNEQVMIGRKRIVRAFKSLEQKLFLIFKAKFDACIQSVDFKPFVPTFYAFHSLIRFTSPFELLDLVNWLFSRIDLDNTTFHQSSKGNALLIGLHLASSTFDLLLASMRQPCTESKSFSSLGGTAAHLDVSLFEEIFFQILEIVCRFKLDIADKCLLKAVNIVKMHKAIQHPELSSIMVISRAMASTPVDIISYCLHKMNRTKADLLYLIAEMNPLYVSVFGFMTYEILHKSWLHNGNRMQETYSFSDEELVMLLPTVFLYLHSVTSKFGKHQSKPFQVIIAEYSRVLFGGFSKWNIFVSGIIFEIGVDGPSTAAIEEFLNIFSDSLLGKAILMAQDCLALSEDTMKVDGRLDLFNSVCPSNADDIFDYLHGETGLCSLRRPLEFVNRVVAKINFCRMLLFSHHNHNHPQLDNGDEKTFSPQVASDIEKLRERLLRMLVNSWKLIVQKFQYSNDYSGDIDGHNLSIFRFLEVFVMNNILELTTKMHDCLTKLDSLPFIEQLVKSFLRYRFGDLATLKMLRNVLTSLSHGKFSCSSVIQLLLAHSQFAQSIHLACESLVSTQFGLVMTPMQSVLRSLSFHHNEPDALDCKNEKSASQECLILLELVKFIRVLFQIYAQQKILNFAEDIDINLKELVYLLLSSYGATCAEVDMEIYYLILEIEATDKSSAGTVAQMDYLWGIASLKVRKEWEQDRNMQSVERSMELSEERRKIKYRENIPIDPKLCTQTVLYFPYNRCVNEGISHKLQKSSSTVMHEVMSYIEPVEYASLGLLAITVASLSSPDDDMRKLGYEALAQFKCALEGLNGQYLCCTILLPKKCEKNVVQLRLVLSCLQNGIEQQWQRIPSIIALFFAEASLIILDSSHCKYSTISEYLSNSPSVNMKAIPLFQNLFWGSSTSFREDRLWMLRLLYVGLNTENDAQTYIRNSVFETLMSFYSSPLSDDDSRELIIQVYTATCALLELCKHKNLVHHYYRQHIEFFGVKFILLEVVHYITSPRNIVEWLQNHAMEQLSELSSHLYKLLISGVELIKEQSILCNSILKILMLVLKISQKRKIYQPHFTLSQDGLFRLYEAVAVCSKTRCCPSMGLGLKAVLMSTPPVTSLWMDKEKFSKFLVAAVTTATDSKSKKVRHHEDSDYHKIAVSVKREPKESLVSKLLRWLTASVILGNISCKLNKLNNDRFLERPSLHTLRSWLDCNEKGFGENVICGCEDILAASIFYLLQLEGFTHSLLPSAVSALCFLLLSNSSSGSLLVVYLF